MAARRRYSRLRKQGWPVETIEIQSPSRTLPTRVIARYKSSAECRSQAALGRRRWRPMDNDIERAREALFAIPADCDRATLVKSWNGIQRSRREL